MPNSSAERIEQIRVAIEAIVGEDAAASITDRWQRFAEHPQPVITIYGPYDSGKSSLLKRLLVEDRTQVPPWLTVSARQETFEVNEIDSGGVTFRDSPGISAGNESHELIARDALAGTDALMLVLPLQLMTTGREQMLAIISGQFYGLVKPRPFPPGALLLVIAQADTAAADPIDDPEGYQANCQRKQEELRRLIEASIGKRKIPIHVIAADPYGMTARQQQPHPQAYTGWADWDGIAGLRAAIQELTSQGEALRSSAQIRYWGHAGQGAAGQADQDLAKITLAADEESRHQEHIRGLETRLDGVDKAAVGELRLKVHNELRSITESVPYADSAAIQAEAMRRLGGAIEVWENRWRIQLTQLARDSAAELAARARRPGAAALAAYVENLLSAIGRTDPKISPALARDLVNQAGMWIPQVALQHFRHHMGMSPVQAQSELEQLKHLQNMDFAGYYSAGYPTADQIVDMRHHLHEVEIAQVAPMLVQLGSLIWASARESQLAKQERERRAQLQAKIEKSASDITDHILDSGWNPAVDELRGQLRGQLHPDELLATMQAHLAQLISARKVLSDLLKSY